MWSLALLINLLCYSLKIQGAPSKTMALGNTFPSPSDTFTLNRSPPACTPSCLPHNVLLFFFFLFLHLSLDGQQFPSIGMEYEWQFIDITDKTKGGAESWKKWHGKIPHLYFSFHFKISIHSIFSCVALFFLSVVSHETLYLLFNSLFWNKPKQY